MKSSLCLCCGCPLALACPLAHQARTHHQEEGAVAPPSSSTVPVHGALPQALPSTPSIRGRHLRKSSKCSYGLRMRAIQAGRMTRRQAHQIQSPSSTSRMQQAAYALLAITLGIGPSSGLSASCLLRRPRRLLHCPYPGLKYHLQSAGRRRWRPVLDLG